MKKILFGSLLFAALFTACSSDDDYNADIAKPQASDATVTHSFGTGSVTEVGVINLADVETENVKVADIAVPTMSSETAKIDSMYISFLDATEDNSVKIETDGTISTAYLTKLVETVYGKRPEEHSMGAVLSAFLSDGNQSFLIMSDDFAVKVIPPAPDIEVAYYLTGSINGWDNTDKTYQLTNDGSDPYENPVFTCRIPAPADGSDVEFKMTPESGIGGDWSNCLAGGSTDGTFVYNNDGGNLVIPAAEGAYFYDLTFNMLELTWTATPLFINIESAYYFTGSINGWNNTDTSYKLTNNGGDPYENPTFTCRIPAPEDGSNVEFKMTPESGLGGDWSGCLAGGSTDGTFVYNNGGGNLFIPAVEGAKFYDLTFNMMDLTWSYKAVSFDAFVYFIGATDGWANAEQKLALTDMDSGTYTGFVYCADPNGWGNEFKFQKVAGNWDTEINSGHMTGGITGDFADGGGNFKANAGEGVYFVTLNLSTNTLDAVKIDKVGIIGDFNGWGGDVDMTWNATDYCFEVTGAGVTTNGWKFRINADWAINLGSNDSVEPSTVLTDLVANGKNIGVAGNTIKLYPTRKTFDKIYCTVE